MSGLSPIHNQIVYSRWGTHRTLPRIARASPIHLTSSTQQHQKNSSDTLLNTSTGAPLKWSPPVSKSLPPETLQDKSYATAHSHFKNLAKGMPTRLRTLLLYLEMQDYKIPKIDKIA